MKEIRSKGAPNRTGRTMNAFIQRIIDAVSKWLERITTRKAVRKKFRIQRIFRNEPEPDLRNRKTFLVEKIEFHGRPESNGRNPGKFTVAGKTRPQQCPYCRTQNNLEQQADRKKWRCRTCDYEW